MSGASAKGGPGLRFGVSAGGYSVEGGYNDTTGPANNWVWWERSGRVAPSGLARDFWARPEVLLDQAADLGCDTFGLSVEWARIEPEDGTVDHRVLDRYAEILDACRARGLEPVVSLHHGTHPWWLGEEYWLTPASPDRFAAHAATVVTRLAGHCTTWVTVVDPAGLAYAGWVRGTCPPGRRLAVADAYAVLDNLLCAHVLAHREIHRAQPDATVLLRSHRSGIYELGRLPVDLVTAEPGGLDELVSDRRRAHDARYGAQALGARALGPRVSRVLSSALSPYGPTVPTGSSRAALGRALADRVRRPAPRRLEAVLADPSAGEGRAALDALWLGSADRSGPYGPTSLEVEQQLEPSMPLYLSGGVVQARELVEAVRSGVPIAGFFLELSGATDPRRGGPGTPPAAADGVAAYRRLIAEVRDGGPPFES